MFQFISKLYLTNQSYLKNMFMLFKSVTTMLIYSIYLLISSSSNMNLVTSPFLIMFVLKTLNDLSIGSVLILSSFTSCLSILVYIHPESTSAFSHSSFLLNVLIFVHMFNSLFLLSH